jgi:hypothetical protein
MEKIKWTDRVRNEEVLHRVKEGRNIVHAIERRKANGIVHILGRNRLLKHINKENVEGGMQVTGRQRRRREQLLDGLQETSERALNRTVWRTRFGRGCEPVVMQAVE